MYGLFGISPEMLEAMHNGENPYTASKEEQEKAAQEAADALKTDGTG